MKFIWNEPRKANDKDICKYPAIHWEQPILGWLYFNNIWPRVDRDHWECSYNFYYHFFDISIFECWLPGNGPPDHVIKDMRSYLERSGLEWSERKTWKWDNHKMRPGVRFWIQAEDYRWTSK